MRHTARALGSAWRRVSSIAALLLDNGEEKLQPLLDLSRLTNRLALVIFSSVTLQVTRHIPRPSRPSIFLMEEQATEEAIDAAVAIQEGVNRLERVLHQRVTNEHYRDASLIDVLLLVCEQIGDVLAERRDEAPRVRTVRRRPLQTCVRRSCPGRRSALRTPEGNTW